MRKSRSNFTVLSISSPPQETAPGLLYAGNIDTPQVPQIGDIVQFEMFNDLMEARVESFRYGVLNTRMNLRTRWILKVVILSPDIHVGRVFEVPLKVVYFLR